MNVLQRANNQGHFYKHVTNDDIARAIKDQLGVAIPPDALHAAHQIKTKGESTIEVRLGSESASIIVDAQAA